MAKAKTPKCELCEAENDGVKFRALHKLSLCASCDKEQAEEMAKIVTPTVAMQTAPDPTPTALQPNVSKAEIGALIIEQVDLLERRKIMAIAPLYRLMRQYRGAK